MSTYQKNIIKLVIEIFSIFLAGSLFIFFLLKNINGISNEIRDKKVFFWTSQNRPNLIVKLQNDYQVIEPYIAKRELKDLNMKLEEISKKNKVTQTFQLINKWTLFANDPKKNSFKITIDGNLKNIINYFRELEALPFFFNIKDANITDKGEKSNLSLEGNI